MLYAADTQDITVTVADDGEGHLVPTKNPPASDNYDAVFTNTKLTEVHAVKVWKSGETKLETWPKKSGSTTENRTVTFQLQYLDTADNDWKPVKADAAGTAITDIEVSGFNTVSFTKLPADKTYRVVETKVDGTASG